MDDDLGGACRRANSVASAFFPVNAEKRHDESLSSEMPILFGLVPFRTNR
jgi:hypothetical protein